MYNYIYREDYYYGFNSVEKKRIKKRLTIMSKIGMEEVGIAQFGIKGIMSGLYIERVWNDSDQDFNDYIKWVKSLINKYKRLPRRIKKWKKTKIFCGHPTMRLNIPDKASWFLSVLRVQYKNHRRSRSARKWFNRARNKRLFTKY